VARIVAGTGIVIDEFKQISDMLRDYPRAIRRKYMKAAFNAVTKPAMRALKQATPRGPTGNLKRSVTKKVSANFAIVGYAAARRNADENQKGYHQNLLEYGGRKIRRTKGRVASTFASQGKGRSGKIETRTTKQGKLRTTRPRFPKGFLKSAPAGERVTLGKMPVGGRTGKPPIRTAFSAAEGEIRSVLKQQMSTVLERANKDMADRAKRGR
jgi:phage gpG-like protein